MLWSNESLILTHNGGLLKKPELQKKEVEYVTEREMDCLYHGDRTENIS